jgi:protein-disulfide isomerase
MIDREGSFGSVSPPLSRKRSEPGGAPESRPRGPGPRVSYDRRMLKVVAIAATLSVVACSSSAQQSAEGEVVAKVGDRAITLKEIEDRWRKDDAAEHAEATQKLYEGRRSALDKIVADILIADAAKGSGMSVDGFEEAEISKRVRQVGDADVQSFYKANINEMGGRTFEQAAPLINRFLQEQYRNTARESLINDLKTKGPAVRVLMEAPRHEVPLAAGDPSRGNISAPVTIVEFSDFQCPYCLRASPTLSQLQKKYGDKLRVVWKDFPLTQIHPDAFRAAEAAHCAGEQGKFWEYHDLLFGNQKALQPSDLTKYAADAKLDTKRFDACVMSSTFTDRVRAGMKLGGQLGVSSTPTLYINGRMVAGAYPLDALSAMVDEELERLKK